MFTHEEIKKLYYSNDGHVCQERSWGVSYTINGVAHLHHDENFYWACCGFAFSVWHAAWNIVADQWMTICCIQSIAERRNGLPVLVGSRSEILYSPDFVAAIPNVAGQ